MLRPVDWGEGHYEHVAPELVPAAEAVVERLEPLAGERVVDLGCGTGNAALLAARRGARVTGVDPSARLLELAEAAARDEGLEADFVQGEAGAMPVEDGAADGVLSVFGVIFAPDANRAGAELARIAAPGGRIVLSAWLPGGAIADVARLRREAIARATGASGGPPPFAWHDREALAGLLGPHGFSVEVDEAEISFTADSPEAVADGERRNHPMWFAARAALEPEAVAALEERALAVYRAANEDAAGFRVTSRYVLATARRDA
jgi:SAM-dependent methyltransferase